MSARKKAATAPAVTVSHSWAISFALVVLVMVCFGLVMAYSASFAGSIAMGKPAIYGMRMQIFSAVVGALVAVFLWRVVPLRWFSGKLAYVFWGICMLFMVATMIFGTYTLGARRWIDLGFLEFQPSEPMKISLIIMTAKLLAEYKEGVRDLRTSLGFACLFILLPLIIIIAPDPAQSDMGTAMIAIVGIVAVMIMGGLPLKWIFIIGVPVAIVGVFAIMGVGYRSDRITAWLDPFGTIDEEGGGYQLVHSYFALANGGFFGVGLGQSYEKFQYLPMAENDMVFAIIGEELGMVGCIAVVVLFMAFLALGLRIAFSCSTDFGKMVSGGLVLMVMFEAFLNIGCVIGLLPITGKPLPFFSMGGTVLLVLLSSMGLVLAASREKDPQERYASRRDDLRLVSTKWVEGESGSTRTSGLAAEKQARFRAGAGNSATIGARTRGTRSASSGTRSTSTGAGSARRGSRTATESSSRRSRATGERRPRQ